MSDFQPRILGFLCNWCSYAGADLAGVSRIQYPPNIRVIGVMCSGRVDPNFIIKAFLKGIDGVMVLGCHFGDCHYINGNYNAEKRIIATQELLSYTPVASERLYLNWVSAAEGMRYAQIVSEFTEKVKLMGPLETNEKITDALYAVKDVVSGENFRHLTGVEWEITEKGNVYGERIPKESFQKLRNKTLYEEYIQACIKLLLKQRPLSVKELVGELAFPVEQIFNMVCLLQDKGIITLQGIKDGYPEFALAK